MQGMRFDPGKGIRIPHAFTTKLTCSGTHALQLEKSPEWKIPSATTKTICSQKSKENKKLEIDRP